MEEMEQSLGSDPADVMRVSAKTGLGVEDLLDAIVSRIPPPDGDEAAPCRPWSSIRTTTRIRGTIMYVRIMNGTVQTGS